MWRTLASPGEGPRGAAAWPAKARLAAGALGALAALASCDKFREVTDRHLGGGGGGLSLGGGSCPDAVPGRAVGSESAGGAFGCFRKAVEGRSVDLMLRVTCQSRSPSSCKQGADTKRAAEETMGDLSRMPWRDVVGRWVEVDNQVEVYAVDTYPREKRVTTVTLCRIVDKTRWAVCEVGEMAREVAERKAKGKG
ncbi:MAG TPA: hypothetical protein VFS43_37575 [Polyangiaceae bacterium]|nr:hypothetical protein [Polyangiaceae bacterium]